MSFQIFQDIGSSTNHIQNHEIPRSTTHIENLKEDLEMLKQSYAGNDKRHQLDTRITQVNEENIALIKTMHDLNTVSKTTTGKLQAVKRKLIDLKDDFFQPQISCCCHKILKIDVENLKSRIHEMSKSVADLDLKLQLQENKTVDGEMIWKIDELDFRMRQARLGKIAALHSAPCYTKQYGYKFCTRLYLQGDGMGKSTHVSILFVVMKSEYDEMLVWPMHKRITFKLINHFNDAESVVETFVSSCRPSSFQRPTNNMNVASGCPMFVSIERFSKGSFIVNNCMYIKTTVQEVD